MFYNKYFQFSLSLFYFYFKKLNFFLNEDSSSKPMMYFLKDKKKIEANTRIAPITEVISSVSLK